MIGYTCKYTPLELMAAFGLDAERMDAEQEDFQEAETLTHANLCSHAKMVIQQGAALMHDDVSCPGCAAARAGAMSGATLGAATGATTNDVPSAMSGTAINATPDDVPDAALGDVPDAALNDMPSTAPDDIPNTISDEAPNASVQAAQAAPRTTSYAIERRYQGVVLTDCCDSLRRAYEVLPQDEQEHYLLDLPHSDSTCAVDRFARKLIEFSEYCARISGTTFDYVRFADSCTQAHSVIPNAPFIAVLGARTSEALLATFRQNLALPVVDLSCGGNRSIGPLPSDAASWDFERLMAWYARELMGMVPCMRMTQIAGRRALLEHPELRGFIYNTVKFCDFYGFDYDHVIRQTSLPVLKLESDFTPTPAGQLATRLQAFSENLGGGFMKRPLKRTHAAQAGMTTRQTAKSSGGDGAASSNAGSSGAIARDDSAADSSSRNAAATTLPVASSTRLLFGGIDSGSTSTNMVIIDAQGKMLAHTSVRTGPKAAIGAAAALEEVCRQLNITAQDITAIVATGYGRDNITFASASVTEITCHARGAHRLCPSARTIVDIGGQDSKIICLDENGSVANFVMNDKCAAGTGRFMEAMARTLELSLDEMSQCGLHWKKDLTISSMCTVFAESEVISLIADNHTDADIIHGLDKAVASKVGSMATRVGAQGPYMMTGGVARNAGVVKALEAKLGEPLFVAEDPDLCGALGAALFALGA